MKDTGTQLIEDRIRDLRENTDFTSTLFDGLEGYAIIAADFDGNVIAYNEGARHIYGYERKEIIGRERIEKFFPKDFVEAGKLQEIIGNLLGEGRHFYQGEKVRSTGERFPAQILFTLTKDNYGSVVGFVEVVEDLTERKKAEREREALLQHLSETNKKLERSNEELQDFVYIASHDLREPLRKISAFGRILRESLADRLDEDEQENLEFMIDGAIRMQWMINDLLVYSRVSTRGEYPETVDMNNVINHLRELELSVQLEETGGIIIVPKPLPIVQADQSQMHQLLQNLVGNALKYRRRGVTPEIIVRSSRGNGNMVCIEVEDNGIGIEQENYDRIFKMFRRLHTDEDYEGSGIGLAVCKKIVERHGGTIGVRSVSGKGSTFWFTLALAEECENERTKTRRRTAGGRRSR